MPLRRGSAVPAELSRLIRAQSRTAALRPVARIATVRRRRVLLDGAGESLAEVVDDEVSAQSLGQVTTLSRWREVEVELTGGGRLLLVAADDRLRKAGLRPAGRAAKLERALADRMPSAAAPPRLKPRSRAGDVVLSYLRGQADALKSADPAGPPGPARLRAPDAGGRPAAARRPPVLPAHPGGLGHRAPARRAAVAGPGARRRP